MNNKGQILIMDLLLYLIIITVILGVTVYLTATLNDNQVTNINNRELNNILTDTASTLTKSSGTPDNWEKLSNMNSIKTVGLKSVNSSLISYDKLMKLKNNNQLTDKFIPEGIYYSITIYPKNKKSLSQLIAGKSNLNTYSHIQSKEIPVVLDYGYSITSLNNNYRCPFNHDKNWKCIAFTSTSDLLNSGEYYIVSDDKCDYILSNTYLDNITGTVNNILSVNSQLKKLRNNDNQTYYLHLNTDNNSGYLVYDKNNRKEFLNSVLEPEVYILNIKVAT